MKIDLFVDLNTEVETGLPWTYADQAADPSIIAVGRQLVVGSGDAVAIAEVVSIAADGLVHVRPMPGLITPERLATVATSN